MIVECLSCRLDHDLTGWSAGATTTCSCGAAVTVPGVGDEPLPCPLCATMIAPSLGQCTGCNELLFTTGCSRCGERLFHGHRFCAACGTSTATSPMQARPDSWAEGTPLPALDQIEVFGLRPVEPDPAATLRMTPMFRPNWRADLAAGTPPEGVRSSRGACPRCRIPLTHRAVGNLELDPCRSCGGVYFTAEVLTELLISGNAADHAALHALVAEPTEPYPPKGPAVSYCPCCADAMEDRQLVGRSPARVAVCHRHGAWIDRSHLAAAMRVLTVRSQARAGSLERAAFRDDIECRRFGSVLAHARALGERSLGNATPRTPLGLIADLFG